MEAKSFLKTTSSLLADMYQAPIQSFSDQQEERNNMIETLKLLSLFYSKPFEEKMVCNLFKFWAKSDFSNDYVSVSSNCIYFVRDTHYVIRKDVKDPATEQQFDVPETLNDFIRDCERAGVILFWKEEIVKKYFQ